MIGVKAVALGFGVAFAGVLLYTAFTVWRGRGDPPDLPDDDLPWP